MQARRGILIRALRVFNRDLLLSNLYKVHRYIQTKHIIYEKDEKQAEKNLRDKNLERSLVES